MKEQQLTRVARYNRAVVLDLIRRFGPLSKTDLADRSGLAVSSVLNVISSLTKSGLVRTVGFGPSTGGRPPVLMELNPDARYAAGVNIHSAGVEAVLVNLGGDIVGRTSMPLQGAPGTSGLVDTVVEAVGHVIRLGRVDAGRILGAGIGVAGSEFDSCLVDQLESKLGLPILLDRSANLCALAEYRQGVGKDAPRDVLAYVYADEAITQGIIIDGKIYRGSSGGAGELGHTVVDVNGPPCGCGSYGCLDALASVQSIIRRVAAHGKLMGIADLEPGPSGDWDAVSFAAIAQAVERSDAGVTAIIDQAIAYLTIGTSNLHRLFQPQRIVLGGQLFDAIASAYDRLQRALHTRSSGSDAVIVRGELGSIAAPLGAATLVLEDFFGIPEQVISVDTLTDTSEPSFEETQVWPMQAAASDLFSSSSTSVLWAGNLRPPVVRVPSGEPVTVSVDVKLDANGRSTDTDVKVLLHWDRVGVFGASWPNPKNSPMHRMNHDGTSATYSATLGSLPPGKYEFAAHIIGANDVWVPTMGAREPNGRLEVLPSRVFAREQARQRKGRKEEERAEIQAIP